MNLKAKFGIDTLIFGMKQQDVTSIYGSPSKKFVDEEENIIWLYDKQKLRLTFYMDEDFRLGYIICSNPDVSIGGQKILGQSVQELKHSLAAHGYKTWEEEDFDMAVNHFNEANWIILQAEFGEVVKVELGAIINDNDEFDWKFKA